MRNTKHDASSLILSLVCSVILSWSCITLPKNLSKNWVPVVKHRTSAPVDAFALIEMEHTARAAGCKSVKKNFDCKKLMTELPELTVIGTGSGILVDSALGPVVLTAAHVCENDVPDAFKHDDVSITIDSTVEITVKIPTKGNYSAVVMKTDEKKDLCLLKPSTIFTNPVPVSEALPTIGDSIYSISAPLGISGSELALIFRGFYSGKDTIRHDQEVKFYTVPARAGSSGGPIFNKNWELIGIIHTAFDKLENVAMGAGVEDIRTFLHPPGETIDETP